MNKYLDDGRKFVLTEQGYKHTPDNVKRERKVDEPIIGYETKVPYSWLKKDMSRQNKKPTITGRFHKKERKV